MCRIKNCIPMNRVFRAKFSTNLSIKSTNSLLLFTTMYWYKPIHIKSIAPWGHKRLNQWEPRVFEGETETRPSDRALNERSIEQNERERFVRPEKESAFNSFRVCTRLGATSRSVLLRDDVLIRVETPQIGHAEQPINMLHRWIEPVLHSARGTRDQDRRSTTSVIFWLNYILSGRYKYPNTPPRCQ